MSQAGARRIVLVGMMGSGKTTVGRLLAARTGWPYIDNDELLTRLVGETPREVVSRGGEEALRGAERAALGHALEQPLPCIVAAAAGVILDPDARAWLRGAGHVVWLRGSAATLRRRAVGGTHRPWLEKDAAAWFEAALAEREPLYESVATLTVDVDRATPAETAALVAERLQLPWL